MTPSTSLLRAIDSRPRVFAVLRTDRLAHALSRAVGRTLCDERARNALKGVVIASTTDGTVRAIRLEARGPVTYEICAACQAHPSFSLPAQQPTTSIREFVQAIFRRIPPSVDVEEQKRMLASVGYGVDEIKLPLLSGKPGRRDRISTRSLHVGDEP